MQRKAVLYDKGGDQHYDYISAWIKSTRGSDPDASLYYLAAMLEGGEDPRFIARRMIILASEDIGNADPQALQVAVAAAHAVEHVGLPECQFALAQAAIYLSLAPKSNAAKRALGAARGAHPRARRRAAAGRAALAPPTRRRARSAAAIGYDYPHDAPGPRQRPGAPARGARGPALLRARRRRGDRARAPRGAPARARARAVSAATGAGRRDAPASSLYDRIGRSYSATREEDPRLAAAVHAALGDARTVLNVGAGSGSYEPGDRDVLAVEPSAVMRAQRPPGAAPCLDAEAEALPFADGAFDAAMAVFSDHHWQDRAAGLRELRRVARRRVVLVQWDQACVDAFWLARDYLPALGDGPPLRDAMAPLGAAELRPLPVPRDCRDGFLLAWWARPEALLDPRCGPTSPSSRCCRPAARRPSPSGWPGPRRRDVGRAQPGAARARGARRRAAARGRRRGLTAVYAGGRPARSRRRVTSRARSRDVSHMRTIPGSSAAASEAASACSSRTMPRSEAMRRSCRARPGRASPAGAVVVTPASAVVPCGPVRPPCAPAAPAAAARAAAARPRGAGTPRRRAGRPRAPGPSSARTRAARRPAAARR